MKTRYLLITLLLSLAMFVILFILMFALLEKQNKLGSDIEYVSQNIDESNRKIDNLKGSVEYNGQHIESIEQIVDQ